MKIKRKFSATTSRGTMAFTARPFIALPLSVHSALLSINGQTSTEAKDFVITVNGAVVASGKGIPGHPFAFSPPFKVPLGRSTLSVSSSPYADGTTLEGEVVLEISIL